MRTSQFRVGKLAAGLLSPAVYSHTPAESSPALPAGRRHHSGTMIRITARVGLAAAAVATLGLTLASPSANAASLSRATADSADTVTQVSMRKVNFYIIPRAALRIRTLRGQMRSIKGGPVTFDDKNAFVIHLDYAEIGLNGNDITALMNSYIFAYPGAPLKHLSVHTSGSQVVQSGVMHKILDIPFKIWADVSVTPDGLIKLHPVRTRILGVNGNDLMPRPGTHPSAPRNRRTRDGDQS